MYDNLVRVARNFWGAVVDAWRDDRRLVIVTSFARLLMALLPASQVVLVNRLLRGDTAPSFALHLLLLAVAVGATYVSGPLSHWLGLWVLERQRRVHEARLISTLAALVPRQLADPQTMSEAQGCRSALMDVSGYLYSCQGVLQGVLSGAAVGVSLWRIDAIAAVLVFSAFGPIIVAASWSSTLKAQEWRTFGALDRRVGYCFEELARQRTAIELALLGSRERFGRLAAEKRNELYRLAMRLHTRVLYAQLIAGAAATVLLAGALWRIATSSHGGRGGLAAGVVGVLAAMDAISRAGTGAGRLMEASVNVAAFRDFTTPRVDVRPHASPLPAPPQVLNVAGLTVHLPGTDNPQVCDVSFSLRRGQVIALVGANGAGKSTLLNALLGVVEPSAGALDVGGANLDAIDPGTRAALFGCLRQDFGRYELSVREALLLAGPDVASSRDVDLWAVLARVGLRERIERLPNGLDSQLGPQWGGSELSGGEWQRLALARVCLRKSPFWLLDEPTSAVDALAEEAIVRDLIDTKSEQACLIVSHRVWCLRDVDSIIVLDRGRVVQMGTFWDLASDPHGHFVHMFSAQLGAREEGGLM